MRTFVTNILLACFAFFLSVACATQNRKPTAAPELKPDGRPPTVGSPETSPGPLVERTYSAKPIPSASASADPRFDESSSGPWGAVPLAPPGGMPVSTPAGRVVPKVDAFEKAKEGKK